VATELATSFEPGLIPTGAAARWRTAAVWSAVWPKLGAVALVLFAWQLVVWSGWRPQSVLPGPIPVLQRLGAGLGDLHFYAGIATTLRRAFVGYAGAAGIGVGVAILVARFEVLRRGVGAVLVGVQSMPSIAWFPFAVILLARSEAAITFVVVLGAAPAIAAGLLSGIDQVQPMQVRVGRSMGAHGLRLYRHVIMPAALPAFVGGLKQGWAFAWRSLMSAELLVAAGTSLGVQLQTARNSGDTRELIAVMIVICFIGVIVDGLFGSVERAVWTRWGLAGGNA
jgi:NitT/TauT family transport system permease protein